MMNKIEAVQHQSKHASASYLMFAIDGMPLDIWLQERTGDRAYLGLVPSLTELTDERELEVAWERIIPASSSQIAPILICPDDLDFWCTVVVAEISKDNEEEICWRRLGLNLTKPYRAEDLGADVDWIERIGPLRFGWAEYISCIEQFRMEIQGHAS